MPVAVRTGDEGRITCELTAPQGLTLGAEVPLELLARAVGARPATWRRASMRRWSRRSACPS